MQIKTFNSKKVHPPLIDCKYKDIIMKDSEEAGLKNILKNNAVVNRVILSNILAILIGDMFKVNQDYGCVNEIF
jgi:hypothetical protein